jgi:type IX secretion system PorP/SprF family membrane protein
MKILLGLYQKIFFFLAAGFTLLVNCHPAVAQSVGRTAQEIDPFESQYFINRYIANPAMAGMDSTLNLNMTYRQQYQELPGAPVTEAFTADGAPGKRVGLGLIAFNDKAGLLTTTRFALTYAYHLPVGQWGEQLHFGISGVYEHVNLDPKGIVGSGPDPVVAEFNNRKNVFEVDYGMAYTDSHVTVQGSLTNLIGYFKKFNSDNAGASTFYLAAAYKFTFDGMVNSIEPEACLRGVKEYNSIVDAGANLTMFKNIFNIYGMIHSSGNFSVGAGLNYKSILYLQGSYLSQTSGLRNYTNGNYEIDIRISLFRKK